MSVHKRWLVIIVGLLVTNALVMGVLVTASSWHPPTVVPRYYERAVAWDQRMADDQLATELGWKIEVKLSHEGVLVRAHDGAGQPVAGARFTLAGFHRGSPAHRADVALVTDDAGVARAVPGAATTWHATPGWYELDIGVHRGDISYSMHREVELPGKVASRQP